jgi:hypothetical protein
MVSLNIVEKVESIMLGYIYCERPITYGLVGAAVVVVAVVVVVVSVNGVVIVTRSVVVSMEVVVVNSVKVWVAI